MIPPRIAIKTVRNATIIIFKISIPLEVQGSGSTFGATLLQGGDLCVRRKYTWRRSFHRESLYDQELRLFSDLPSRQRYELEKGLGKDLTQRMDSVRGTPTEQDFVRLDATGLASKELRELLQKIESVL
jgi:hypothetical protein